jgi:hypothetical protein
VIAMSYPFDVEDDGTPRAALDVAGQGVRAFNHRTAERFNDRADGWSFPNDAYRALGELTYLVGALPQVLQHIMSSLRDALEQGHVGIDRGEQYEGHPELAIEAVSVAMEKATQAVHQMYRGVANAQSVVARAHYTGPDLREENWR